MIVSNQEVSAVNVTPVVVSKEASSKTSTSAIVQLFSMEAKRIEWENGVYRTSNQALYQVLAECSVYCGELTVSLAKARNDALASFYKERGYRYREDMPLVTRVVRAVFGDVNRRRISTYSLVLRQAQKENVGYADLPAWIEARGGIQEIRLSRSATFVSPADKVSQGKAFFQNQADLGTVKSELLSIEANPDFIGQACLLLAEQQANNSYQIRAVVRSQAAINAAYAALYSKEKEVQAKAKKEQKAANDADGKVQSVA